MHIVLQRQVLRTLGCSKGASDYVDPETYRERLLPWRRGASDDYSAAVMVDVSLEVTTYQGRFTPTVLDLLFPTVLFRNALVSRSSELARCY